MHSYNACGTEASSKLIFYDITSGGGALQVMANMKQYSSPEAFVDINGFIRKGDIIGTLSMQHTCANLFLLTLNTNVYACVYLCRSTGHSRSHECRRIECDTTRDISSYALYATSS